MMTAEPEMPERGTVRAQLIGGHPPRCETLFSQQLAHQPDCRTAVSPALKQHIEDLAFVVDRAPEMHPFAGNPDHHLVKMPAIARPGSVLPQLPRDQRPEF